MAIGVTKRKGKNGAVSFLAQVRLEGLGFKSAAKTFKTRTEAHNWARDSEKELKAQAASGSARGDVGQLTLAQLIREYLADPDVQQLASYKLMQRVLDDVINKFGSHRLIEFGVQQLRQARAQLHSAKRGPLAVNRYLSCLRSAWNWGRDAGLVPTERVWPQKLMMKEPPESKRARFLSDSELPALLKAAERDPVLRAPIIISMATGLRKGELLRLKWSDIDLEKATCCVHKSKNKTRRQVHLTSSAVAAFTDLRKRNVRSLAHPFLNTEGDPLTETLLNMRWRAIVRHSGIENFRWHDLRHTCASLIAQNGGTLLEIGSVLGHKGPSMTWRYAHLVQGKAVTGHAALDAKIAAGLGAKLA